MGIPSFNSIVYVADRLASKLSSESDEYQTFLPRRESIRMANCQPMIQFHYYFKVSRSAKVRLTIPLPRLKPLARFEPIASSEFSIPLLRRLATFVAVSFVAVQILRNRRGKEFLDF